MTPELWAALIPAVVGLLVAAASWLHSKANRVRISELERNRGQGRHNAGSVAPRQEK
jgi:hypothetical protein